MRTESTGRIGAVLERRHEDRRAAGIALAGTVARRHLEPDFVVGLVRGGVPLAVLVAQRIWAPFGATAVSVLRTPAPLSIPMGAAAADGTLWIDDDLVRTAQIDAHYRDTEAAAAIVRSRWTQRQLGAAGSLPLAGRSVMLVDDGLLWAGRAAAAARWARKHGARHVTLAVPVACRAAVERLRHELDGLVALRIEDAITNLDEAYVHLPPVDMSEILTIARHHAGGGRPARRSLLQRSLAVLRRRRPAFAT